MNQVVVMTQEQLAAFAEDVAARVLAGLPSTPDRQQPEIIDPAELCKRLNISIPTQIRWRKKGKLPFMLIGNQIRYDWHQVIEKLKK